jgi:HSP20 family protein
VSKRVGNTFIEELMGMKKRMDALYAESLLAVEETREAPDADTVASDWKPSADVWETAQYWKAVVDLPGVVEADLQVEVRHNHLTVKGERKPAWPEQGVEIIRQERPTGYFSRNLALPESVAVDQIHAEFKQGLLTIQVPKNSSQSRKISVRID